MNTDREIYRERPDDYYADSIHVTEGGGIGINCGGTVYVRPLREWHRLAALSERVSPGNPHGFEGNETYEWGPGMSKLPIGGAHGKYETPPEEKTEPAETADGMRWNGIEEHVARRVDDLDFHGELWGIRFSEGCGNGCVELYVEDDEWWHLKATFDRVWLNDLSEIIDKAKANAAQR